MRLLHYLEIENFKRFGDKQRIGLDHPAVLIGPNNCGKTSVMEAIQFLRSGSPANIYNIARLRDRTLTFFSNSLYMIVHRSCFTIIIISPYIFKKFFSRKNTIFIFN